jgi:protein-disulfide isomerase
MTDRPDPRPAAIGGHLATAFLSAVSGALLGAGLLLVCLAYRPDLLPFDISDKIAAGLARDLRAQGFVADEIAADPQIVVDAMVAWSKAQEAFAPEIGEAPIAPDLVAAILDPAGGVTLGADEGPVDFAVFIDPNCRFCRMSIPGLLALIDANPDLRVLFRETPIVAPSSPEVSRVALGLAQQGLYRPWLERVAAYKGEITRVIALDIAEEIGADLTRIVASSEASDTAAAIADSLGLAAEIPLQGTPSFVIGDHLITGHASAIWLADYLSINGTPVAVPAGAEREAAASIAPPIPAPAPTRPTATAPVEIRP